MHLGCFVAVAACSTPVSTADANRTLITHDVRNLVPPDADVKKPADTRLDTLVQNIKAATGPRSWDGDSGSSIQQIEGGYLLVKADPTMQRKVIAFLEDLDRFNTRSHIKPPPANKKD